MLDAWLKFEKMISPMIIRGLFLVFAAIHAFIGLFMALAGLLRIGTLPGMGLFLVGLTWMVIGPLCVRIICELAIVQFLIHETLVAIRTSLRGIQQ